jgi:hypothetical protein
LKKIGRIIGILFCLVIYPVISTAEMNLLDVQVVKLEDKTKIILVGDTSIKAYESALLTHPPGIVIDIADTICTPQEISVASGGITRIQVIQQKDNKTRVIIGLIKSLPYQINKIKNKLEISISNLYSEYQILDINVREEEDRIMIIISTSGVPRYKYFDTVNPPRIIFDFLNATSDKVQDISVTTENIVGIKVVQRYIEPIKVSRILIETKESFPYSVSTQGKAVLLTLKKYRIEELYEPEEVKPRKEVVRKYKKPVKEVISKYKEPVKFKKKRYEKKEKPQPRKPKPKIAFPEKYKIHTISMDFKDADLLDVLRLISHKVGVNIVPGPAVKGIITLRLENVPWETALDVILKAQGYTYIKEDNLIRVDTEDNLRGEMITKVIPLNYALAPELRDAIMGALTKSGSVVADQRTNSIIVTDTIANMSKIEQLIKELDTETKQVMIEAKIVEVYLDKNDQLGFLWTIKDFLEGFEISSLMTENMPLGDRGEFIYKKLTPGHDISGIISALVAEGKANVLSSPRIMTLHGREARIMVGEEIPYQQTTTSQAGVVQTNVLFRKVGVKLTVTPFINPKNYVTLTVKPEVSSFKGWAFQTPILSTKSSVTQLMIKDGETVVIGGIIDDHGTQQINKVPILGDLPFIGHLFRVETKENRKTELVIFITPHIKKYS